ncbi:MAG: ATP phosphoribosyltransferase [Candidatus Gracilibacteria bacterium]
MKSTIFGVPSGSLQTKTIALLAKSGIIQTTELGRTYEIQTEYDNLIIRILDRRDMPRDITDGIADFGITGSDYYEESGYNTLKNLGAIVYSRASNAPTRLVLAGPDGRFSSREDVKGTPIYTELPNLTRKQLTSECGFLDSDILIRPSNGKTETAGAFRGAAFTDITETGNTLRANGMKILATIFVSSPTIYARPESWKNPDSRRIIEDVSCLLWDTLKQENAPQVMVEMNVPRAQLEEVCRIIPSDVSPTILPEQNPVWVVVKTLMSRRKFINIVGNLTRLGVRGIVSSELQSVVTTSNT